MPSSLRTRLPLVAALLLTAGALLLRVAILDGRSEDYWLFKQWLDFLQAEGVRAGLTETFRFGYPPSYMYMLVAGDLLSGGNDEVTIKLAPVVCDVVLAFFAYKVVAHFHPIGYRPLVAFGAVLYAPTVVLNSAHWGQIDSVWTAAIVACVFFVLSGRESLAFVCYGLAIAVKAQAMFFVPVLLVLALRGRVRWRSFLLVPLTYAVVAVPAVIAGASPMRLARVYYDQAGYYGELTLNAANFYQWIPERFSDRLATAALVGAAIVILVFVLLAYRLPGSTTDLGIVAMAASAMVLVPYVLPHMHERYFYAGDVLVIVLAVLRPRWALVAFVVVTVSLLSYYPFLFRSEPVSLTWLAVVELAALVALGVLTVRTARQAQPTSGGRGARSLHNPS